MAPGSEPIAAVLIFPSRWIPANNTFAPIGNRCGSASPTSNSLTSFIAEAGKTYFFQVRVHVESEGRESQIWYIELQPINADEGRYLVASSPLSVFQAKK
jgi:hypothetical protein